MSEEYKCDICGAPATVHLTQIVDGKIHKAHLCANCAAKNKVAELPILKFTEMLAKTLASGGKKASQEISETDAVGRRPGKICPVCGMTDLVFEKKHLFGCPHCYEVFSEEVAALLPKIQRGRNYRGGNAKNSSERKNAAATAEGVPADGKAKAIAVDPAVLRQRLKSAVEHEDYALAARLRDELRACEKKSAVPEKKKKRVPAKKSEAENRAPASSAKAKKPRSRASGADGKKSSGGEKS